MNKKSEQEFFVIAERYWEGGLTENERLDFEQYCKDNPELAHLIESHRVFLEKYKRHASRSQFKSNLKTVATAYQAGHDVVRRPVNVVSMWNKIKINALIAASVAVLSVFSTLWLSGYYSTIGKTTSDFRALRREINTVKKSVNAQNAVLQSINSDQGVNPGQYGATGFVISGDGYVVTNYHVIRDADSIHLYSSKGETYKARIVYAEPSSDLALLYVADTSFRKWRNTPYAFKEKHSELGEEVFTIGFPRDEAVYGQGYLSSRTGYSGDTTAYQISIPLNPGNSGGPLLDEKGNVIGIVSGKQTGLDGASFAIKTGALMRYIDDIPQDSLSTPLVLNRKNTLSHLSRPEQVKKIQDYVFMVKTY